MLIEWMRIIDLKDVHLHKVALSQNSDYDRKKIIYRSLHQNS